MVIASAVKNLHKFNVNLKSLKYNIPTIMFRSSQNHRPRFWEDTQLGGQFRSRNLKYNGVPFIVMSYNILSQHLLEMHPYLYAEHNRNHLPWKFRLQRIIDAILHCQPHILCLQEVESPHFKEIKERLKKLNFKSVKFMRGEDKPDGCAIFYNINLFNYVDVRNINLLRSTVPVSSV